MKKKYKESMVAELTIKEENIEQVLAIKKVKHFLFDDEKGYFKKKYGVNFKLEDYDFVKIKWEIMDSLYTLPEENFLSVIKKYMRESKFQSKGLYYSLSIYSIHIIFLVNMMISLLQIFSLAQIDFSILRKLITFISLAFVFLLMAIFFKIFKFNQRKGEDLFPFQEEEQKENIGLFK
jgi:hypothetical protein